MSDNTEKIPSRGSGLIFAHFEGIFTSGLSYDGTTYTFTGMPTHTDVIDSILMLKRSGLTVKIFVANQYDDKTIRAIDKYRVESLNSEIDFVFTTDITNSICEASEGRPFILIGASLESLEAIDFADSYITTKQAPKECLLQADVEIDQATFWSDLVYHLSNKSNTTQTIRNEDVKMLKLTRNIMMRPSLSNMLQMGIINMDQVYRSIDMYLKSSKDVDQKQFVQMIDKFEAYKGIFRDSSDSKSYRSVSVNGKYKAEQGGLAVNKTDLGDLFLVTKESKASDVVHHLSYISIARRSFIAINDSEYNRIIDDINAQYGTRW